MIKLKKNTSSGTSWSLINAFKGSNTKETLLLTNLWRSRSFNRLKVYVPVNPTFFLQLRHLFFFFFPSFWPSESCPDEEGEAIGVSSSAKAAATARSDPEASDSILWKKKKNLNVKKRIWSFTRKTYFNGSATYTFLFYVLFHTIC